ncbi:MAG: hypothetical protein ACOYEV_13800 [Candidatus Nanopelagicales bacterium]
MWVLPTLALLARETGASPRAAPAVLLGGCGVVLFSWFNKWSLSPTALDSTPLVSFIAWNPYVLMALATIAWIISGKGSGSARPLGERSDRQVEREHQGLRVGAAGGASVGQAFPDWPPSKPSGDCLGNLCVGDAVDGPADR